MIISDFINKHSKYFTSYKVPLEFKDEFNQKIMYLNLFRGKLAAFASLLLLIISIYIDLFINRRYWDSIPAYKNLYHLHILGISLILVLIILYYINNKKNLKIDLFLHYSLIICQLLWNEAASVNAQFIHGQISAYIVALVCISAAFLHNKIESLIIISFSYITFIMGLIVINLNQAELVGNIINVLTLSVCSYAISQVFFSMYVKNFLINKQLESALKMKDEFLSLMSHELKTPLTVINAAVQTIESLCKEEMSERLKRYMGNIKQNSNRQLRLVNNILDITRINSGRIKLNKKNIDIVFLSKAIVDSVSLYSEEKGIKLSFSSEYNEKIIGIDEEKYERILLNLLSNAIKFTESGKSINVRLSYTEGKILIEVHDKGIGIPKDKLELIFERFGQVDSSLSRQAEGTGIGLSLVKLFVEVLDGTIQVTSEIRKGSTFSVTLPNTKVNEEKVQKNLMDVSDSRIIQSVHIELSDIYLN